MRPEKSYIVLVYIYTSNFLTEKSGKIVHLIDNICIYIYCRLWDVEYDGYIDCRGLRTHQKGVSWVRH